MEKLIGEKQAAEILGLTDDYLQGNRYRRGNDFIPFVRIGRRAVRYRLEDLQKVINARLDTGVRAGK